VEIEVAEHQQLSNVLAAYFCKICIRMAGSWMQISFGWSPAACKLLIKFGTVADPMGQGQPACQEEWKMCRKKK
jgi:hypothetical protein